MNAVEHALLAVMAANGGDASEAQDHISHARRHARATAAPGAPDRQRSRALVIGGDTARAAGLTLEHTAGFPMTPA